MATFGLRINQPYQGLSSSQIGDLGKALFGDPEMAIKYARLKSDLQDAEYYRRAQEAATNLNLAKEADQLWKTGAMQAAGPWGSRYLQDAMGPLGGAGGGNGEPPAPIELGDPNAVPIPAPRPADPNLLGPDIHADSPFAGRPGGPIPGSSYASPIAGRPGGPLAPYPAAIQEPDLRLSTFPRVSDYMPPDMGPELGTRPGVLPDMPAPIEGAPDYGPSMNEAIPFSVDELLGTAPAVVEPPQVPFNPLQGQPNFFPDYHDRAMPSGPLPLDPPDPYAGTDATSATPDQFITLSDILNYFKGDPNRDPTVVETPEAPAWDPRAPAQENTLDNLRPTPDWNPRGAPGIENTLDLPQPVPVAPFDAGLPLDENTLEGTPPSSNPFPDVIPLPPEQPLRSSPQGAVTEIPGRALSGAFPSTPADVPPPVTPGTVPAPGLPADVPPAIGSPQIIPGKPYQGPPVPLPETPDAATGETDVRAPPITLQDKSGKPVARMDEAGTLALSNALLANGGDIAGAFNKLAGGMGLVYGDLDDTSRARINYALQGGNLTTTTQINAADTTAADTAIKIAQGSPQSLDSQTVQADGILYIKDPDPNAAPGSLMIAPGQADHSGHLKGTSETISAYNTLIDINRELDKGRVPDATKLREYGAAWKILNDPVTTSTRDSEGKLQASTVIKPPPGTLFRSPDALVPGPVTAPVATPAEVKPGETQADQVATDRPAVPGTDIMVTPLYGRNKGKPTKVVNMDGWTSPGEKPPTKTDVIDTPGGGKVVTSVTGDKKTGQISDGARNTARFLYEAIPAAAFMNTVTPGTEPTRFQRAIEEFSKTGIPEGYWLNPAIDEDTRAFARAMYTFINGRVRPDSGATIKPDEFVQYMDRFIVKAGATPRDYVEVMANRAASMRASRKTLVGEYPAEGLQDLDMQATKYGIEYDYDPATDERYQEFLRQIGKGGAGGGGGGGAVTVDDDGKLKGL
jgi:hypothetical protein